MNRPDYAARGIPLATPLVERQMNWELYSGTLRLYIVGPGQDAMFPVTAPNYSKDAHGTPQEREIARRAVSMLSIKYHDNREAGPKEIREALEACGWTADELTSYPKES